MVMALGCVSLPAMAEESATVAKIGETSYVTLADAVANVKENETITILAGTINEGTIKLPATLKNVTFKGAEGAILEDMTIMASDGNSFSYIGLTFDGITFDNSRLIFTGWRNGEEVIEDLTITNCVFQNLNDTTNNACVHINKDASEPVNGFTFTNNVIDGATGGSKSGIYTVNTGKVIITDNTFNNIVFRPALVQLADSDGTVDNVVVSNNVISNTTRLQIYGSELKNEDGTYTPVGTDTLAIAINDNIFQNITGYYICTWGINGESDIAENYYDGDISGKIYWNNEKPADEAGLAEIGVYPYYTELNADGTINEESIVNAPEDLKGSGTAEDPYLINDVDDLKWFRDDVNGGNTYAGKYVKVTATEIDLSGTTNWTPIGTSDNSFWGHFDGNNAVIKNLVVDMGTASNAGFFGFTQNGSVKNITFNNAKVSGRLNVGVAAGTPYTSKYDNIKVTGHVEVNGMAYVGGVFGKNVYADVTDISVNVDDTSYVNAVSTENGTAYRTYVGGVIGFMGEGGHTVKNVTSNISVKGDVKDVGGITGIAHYGNNFENITCTGNVECTNTNTTEIGGIAGTWHNQAGQTVTFNNISYTGKVTVDGKDVTSTNAYTGEAYSPNNTTTENSGSLIIDGETAWPIPELPTATVTELSEEELGENAPELTFALNFKADEVTKEQLDYYGDWFADYVLTINKDFTANADGSADGYLAGQYDTYSENWVSVPFENVTLEAGTKLRVLKYALEGKLTDYKTPLTYKDVYNLVKEFNCGIYFDEDYIAANPDLKVTLELRMYHPDESKNKTYVIGRTYEFAASDIATPVAEVNGVGYSTLQAALDAAAAGTGNVTVEILDNINLAGVDWNPVTVSAPGYPVVTVNGNGKTITGLNDMLFAGTWAGGSGLIINDLTIADSNIVNDKDDAKGNVGVGAFIGYPQASATITLNNCHLVNSTVEGGHWTGGLIGIAGGYSGDDGPVFMNLTIENCSVTGSTITGKGSAGGISGHAANDEWTNVVITDTTVSGNTITSTGSSNNKAGAVMGTIGAAGQSATANGNTKTGGVSVSATVSGNTVTSNGTPITTIYGRQGSTTGMLYVTGGTYDNNPIEENVAYAQPAEGYEIVQNEDKTWGVQEKAPEVEKFNFTGATVTLGNAMQISFFAKQEYFDGEDYFAIVEHVLPDGTTSEKRYEFEEWEARRISSVDYYAINYSNLAARQIADEIRVTIYKTDGTQVSNTRVDGLSAYAYRTLEDPRTDEELRTALVDMLNYGAAAQLEFDYNKENLANANADKYQHYATTDISHLKDESVPGDYFVGTTLTLKNNIQLTGYFKNLKSDMYAVATFTNHSGHERILNVSGTDFVKFNSTTYGVCVDNLVVADAAQLVTITVYNADGSVYDTLVDSINAYLKRSIEDGAGAIYEAIAKFTRSAYNTLH